MNRALAFGIAMFFAVVGIALVGGEQNSAEARFGCHGCGGLFGGHHRCGGCGGLFGHHRNRCCGYNDCCNTCNTCCGTSNCCEAAPAAEGGAPTTAPVEEPKAAPPKPKAPKPSET